MLNNTVNISSFAFRFIDVSLQVNFRLREIGKDRGKKTNKNSKKSHASNRQ